MFEHGARRRQKCNIDKFRVIKYVGACHLEDVSLEEDNINAHLKKLDSSLWSGSSRFRIGTSGWLV